jgi:uncharacterized protein YkwD
MLTASFEDAVALDAGVTPEDAVFADFDGDSVLDLAVLNEGSVGILAGQGDGTFGVMQSYAFGDGGGRLAAGDLNGDGRPDLVIAESGVEAGLPSVRVMINDGSGAMTLADSLNSGDQPIALTLADVDDDGALDLAVVNLFNTSGGANQDLWVYLGGGDGSFGDPSVFAVNQFSTSIASGDFDGDGAIDFAVASLGFGSGGSVKIMRGDGSGQFTALAQLAVGGQPQRVIAADLDGDGRIDIATPNQTTEDISVLLNEGGGDFAPAVGYALGDQLAAGLAVDADLDGDIDLLAVNNATAGQLYALTNDGGGAFGDVTTFGVASRPRAMTAGDVDGDGDSDVVVVGSTSVVFLENLAVTPGTERPARPDLVAASDSGSSTVDNVTALNNSSTATRMTFTVAGVSPGATVTLFAGGTAIGSAIATSPTVSIVTDGVTTLADGAHQITAIATSGGDTSPASDPLTITVDSVAPVFTSSADPEATVGQLYSYDAVTTEEGAQGLLYTLLTAPDGMEVNVETGALTWAPTEDDLGVNGVTIRATDLAGNTADQTFGITVVSSSGSTFEPSAREQYMLELVNRMRTNPADELDLILGLNDPTITGSLIAFGVDLTVLATQWAALTPTAPVAWNEALYNAALEHTTLMRDRDEQSNQLPGELPLGQRVQSEGYDFTAIGENVYGFAQSVNHAHAAFAIDWAFAPEGINDPPVQRENIMDPDYFEVGIAILDEAPGASTGPLLLTQDFGDRSDRPAAYLLGVTFSDADQDAFYDEGEGLGGVTVTAVGDAGTFTTSSLQAGGYQMLLPVGDYDVTFSGVGFSVPVTATATVGETNVKLDAIAPPAAPATPNLAVASDTGGSNSDDITSLNNADANHTLDFVVSGVLSGATVTLYADGAEIGQGVVPDGETSVTITTDGGGALADGEHTFTAIQSRDGRTGGESELATITIDSVAPVFTTAALATAPAVEPYQYDADTSEEGDDGHRYELTTAPDGMTIDAETGLVLWTAAADQVGDYDVVIVATDLAGNTTEQAYTLTITTAVMLEPDLVPTVTDAQIPDLFIPGNASTVSVLIANLGVSDATGSIDVRYYLSADRTLDVDDALVAEATGERINIKSGRTQRITEKFDVPDDVEPGSYFIIADVDTGGDVDEVTETNNVAASELTSELAWRFGSIDGRNVKLTVRDSDGTPVEFSTRQGGLGEVTGGAAFETITITGSAESTQVRIRPKDRGATTSVGTITSSTTLRYLIAKDVDVRGDVSLSGGVQKLLLRDVMPVDGGTITLGALADASKWTVIKLRDVRDVQLTNDMIIKNIQIARWIDASGAADSITTPSIRNLKVTGDGAAGLPGEAQMGLTIAGDNSAPDALRRAVISDGLTGGTWTITGGARLIKAGFVGAEWTGSITGELGTLKSNSDFSGSLTATQAGTIKVGRDLLTASIRTTLPPAPNTYALRTLKVGRWMSASELRSVGFVNKVDVRGAIDSIIFAGVRDAVDDLPDPTTDFNQESKITTVKIRGISGEPFSYINTNIAASRLLNVSYTFAQTDNGGTPFGITADTLRSLKFQNADGGQKWPNRDEPDGPAPDGDRVVRLTPVA